MKARNFTIRVDCYKWKEPLHMEYEANSFEVALKALGSTIDNEAPKNKELFIRVDVES